MKNDSDNHHPAKVNERVIVWKEHLRSALDSSLTRLGSMPLTWRSCSSIHCDLRTNDVEPSNCLTFVMDACVGFLFVTAEKRPLRLVSVQGAPSGVFLSSIYMHMCNERKILYIYISLCVCMCVCREREKYIHLCVYTCVWVWGGGEEWGGRRREKYRERKREKIQMNEHVCL